MRGSLGGEEIRPAWQRYGAAAVLTIVIVAARLGLDPWWGRQHNRHLVFLPTVMLAPGSVAWAPACCRPRSARWP